MGFRPPPWDGATGRVGGCVGWRPRRDRVASHDYESPLGLPPEVVAKLGLRSGESELISPNHVLQLHGEIQCNACCNQSCIVNSNSQRPSAPARRLPSSRRASETTAFPDTREECVTRSRLQLDRPVTQPSSEGTYT